MEDDSINKLFEDVFSVIPVFSKKVFNVGDKLLKEKDISRGHIKLIFIINKYGKISSTDLGKSLDAPKSNITNWVDKLVKINLAERITCESDRRLTYIQLTKDGKDFVNSYFEVLKDSFGHKLWHFSEEDLNLLKETVNNMKKLLEKIKEDY